MRKLPPGVWPVMLTPFRANGAVDFPALDALTDWYLASGVAGLFAVCLSSEMYELTPAERLAITQRIVARAAGKVPVVAAGAFGPTPRDQSASAQRIADTGVAAVILVANQLAAATDSDQLWQDRAAQFLSLTPNIPLGLYECPAPYHRTLTPAQLAWAANTGRFCWIKDTCCTLADQHAKIHACHNTPLLWLNAHGPSLLDSLNAGGHGYSGIAANFFPHLYVWLCAHHATHPAHAARLQALLTVADTAVRHRYPASAKEYLAHLGLPLTPTCRTPVAPSPNTPDDNTLLLSHLRELIAAAAANLP